MVKVASGISGRSLGAVAPALWLVVACGGHSTKPGTPADGGAGGEPGAPPAGQCSFSETAFSAPAARPRVDPPALVAVPDGVLSAWRDDRDVHFGLYAQRLDPEGAAAGSELQLVPGNAPESVMSLAWSGKEVALAWSDATRVHLSLLDSDGELSSSDVWTSAPADYTSAPRLASAGELWGLVWQDGPGLVSAVSRFALVGPGGETGEPLVLAPDSASAREPQICFTGQRFGVVWNDRRSGKDEVWFSLIDAAGKSVITGRRVAPLEGDQASEASIACEGDGFAIAWNERLENDDLRIHLQRMDAQGDAVGEPLAWPGILGAVAFDGRELQLLRYESFGVTGLWLERLAGGAQLEQRLAQEFSGTALHLPLVAGPQRSVIAWSHDQRLMTASFECP
jgi:hypothetical protein